VNIGKIIVPGPTVGRDYAYFEEIARDPRASFLRSQVRERGAAPSVLCTSAEVFRALVGVDGCSPKVTRLVQDPMEMMQVARENSDVKESLILGSPRSTMRNLAQQQKTFDAIFLPDDLLADAPESLLAPGGRILSLETLPFRSEMPPPLEAADGMLAKAEGATSPSRESKINMEAYEHSDTLVAA